MVKRSGTDRVAMLEVAHVQPPEACANCLTDLIAEVALAFVRASAGEIDNEVNTCLKRIGLAFDLDRSTVAEYDAATGSASISHGWARQADQLIGPSVNISATMPWLVATVSSGNTVIFSRVDQLPPEAAVDVERMGLMMPKSNITVPIKLGSVIVGGIGFGMTSCERAWSSETVRQLSAIAGILGSALGRKKTERENLRLREDLTYMSRVSSMGELAAALAHELNQPLTAILANAQAIQSMLGNENLDLEEIADAIGDIVHDDQRATEIIRQLRSMFRREELHRVLLEPAEVVREVGRLLDHDARMRRITLSIQIAEPLPEIYGDRTQLQQVIINLVMNAFDAISAATELGPREALLRVEPRDFGQLFISVKDSGLGIAPANIGRIFEPFFTTKPHGTGIGLSLSRSIVEAHHGTITVAPNRDRGVTFEVALPVFNLEDAFTTAARHLSPS